MPVSVIILAAGSSSRMRQSKQLLPWKDGTLLTHTIKTAIDSRAGHVYVVLGSNLINHKNSIKEFPVTVVDNEQWKNGMGSSIKAGLKAAKDSEAVLIMTCDMPFVTIDHINNMIDHYKKTDQKIVASRYLDTIGVPALFDKSLYSELFSIDDQEGARKIITLHNPATILLKSGTDLDTPEDYNEALSN